MIEKVVDKWIVLAAILTMILAIPFAIVSVLYGMVLLVIFNVCLIPVGFIYVIQWVSTKITRKGVGSCE